MTRILVATAVLAERNAVLRGLKGTQRFDVVTTGVGQAAAAAVTAKALAKGGYGLVVSTGIGGGFPDRAQVGSLVVASNIIAADLGVRTQEGFITLDELGFGSNVVHVETDRVRLMAGALAAAGLPVSTGPVLTVSTVTGTAEGTAELATRFPGAAAEAMEGYGVAAAAQDAGVPVLELRAISNPVGPRNRAEWRIETALDMLEAACAVLVEAL